ncbi:NHL domain containing protein, partial [Asbolus verrucosus]
MSCCINPRASCSLAPNCDDMDISQSPTLQVLCGNCDGGTESTLKCIDCDEPLCGSCVEVHRRERFIKDHRICQLSDVTRCDIHRMSHRLFCATCYVAVCNECLLSDHVSSHEVFYLKESDNPVAIRSELRDNLVFDTIPEVAEAINDIKVTINMMPVEMQKATANIKHVFKHLSPCENEYFHFTIDNNSLLAAINSLGKIMPRMNVNYPIRSYLEFSMLDVNHLLGLELNLNFNSRPVYGLNREVIVNRSTPIRSLNNGQQHARDPLKFCWGVCCNSLGQIIVSDYWNNCIRVFDSSGRFLREFGRFGTGWGQFHKPAGVAVNPFNHIVVADKANNRVQIFSMTGSFILSFGKYGKENGQFRFPWDVACNCRGYIVVSDGRNHRIQLFSNEGVFIGKFGYDENWKLTLTEPLKILASPRGVCFTPTGDVVVTDNYNHRIVIVDKNLKNAQILGEKGRGPKQFVKPQGVICDDKGHIVVADTMNYRIQAFRQHDYLFSIDWDQHDIAQIEWKAPWGICFNPQSRIVVTDFKNP